MTESQTTLGPPSNPKPMLRVNPLETSRFNISSVATSYSQIPVDKIRPGTYQTRRKFKPKALKELAESMEATGINFTPIIVRPLKHSDGYEIISGERRWRAAQMINLPVLLCCVGNFTDEQALYICSAENIQREDLNALEEAYAFELMTLTGMSHEMVAAEIGKSRGHVSNYLRLLSLPLAVRDLISDEKLTYAQARPLCSLPYPGQQINIARTAVTKRWSAKKIEAAVAEIVSARKKPAAKAGVTQDADIEHLKRHVAEQTGYACAIVKTPSGGWQIGFNAGSLEEFQGILERFGVKTDEL